VVLETYFTTCPLSFGDVRAQTKDDLIPIEIFLKACTVFADLLDRLAGSLLSPLRTDVLSNTQKIRKAKETIAPTAFYLQVSFYCLGCGCSNVKYRTSESLFSFLAMVENYRAQAPNVTVFKSFMRILFLPDDHEQIPKEGEIQTQKVAPL